MSLQLQDNSRWSVQVRIDAGAGKLLRVRRIFAQMFPNLSEKYYKDDLQKNGTFFQIKALQAPFLPKFRLTFLKRTK